MDTFIQQIINGLVLGSMYALVALGYTVPPSQANFVWLPLGAQTADFAAQSAEARVLVRPYGNEGARVSIGAPAENDAFLTFPAAWIRPPSGPLA